MQMNKLTFLIIVILSLSGCATEAKYQTTLESWRGHNIEELYQEWGYPASSFDLANGNKMYLYTYNADMSIPIQTFPDGQPNPLSAQPVEYNCKTYFEVDQNKRIVNYSYEGSGCVSR